MISTGSRFKGVLLATTTLQTSVTGSEKEHLRLAQHLLEKKKKLSFCHLNPRKKKTWSDL